MSVWPTVTLLAACVAQCGPLGAAYVTHWELPVWPTVTLLAACVAQYGPLGAAYVTHCELPVWPTGSLRAAYVTYCELPVWPTRTCLSGPLEVACVYLGTSIYQNCAFDVFQWNISIN